MAKKLLTRQELSCNKAEKASIVLDYERTSDSALILMQAVHLWEGLDNFRKKTKRYRDYMFGKQWEDMVPNPYYYEGSAKESPFIKEGELIKRQNRVPLKSNMIRPFIKSVLGNFTSNKTEPVCMASDRADQSLGEMMSAMMKSAYNLNEMWELDRRTLETFLVSAVCANKVTYRYDSNKGMSNAYVYPVNYNNLFFDNKIQDSRMWDCNIIGEIHDYTIEELIDRFSNNGLSKAKRLREIYASISSETVPMVLEGLTSERIDNLSALIPTDANLCRVIEVWRLEYKERVYCHDILKGEHYKIELSDAEFVEKENARRIKEYADNGIEAEDVPIIEMRYFIDKFWIGRWLSPYGDVLKELESPYWHKEHPYTLLLYPLYDGEVHSFVEDLIDQQRYINRLVTMIDFLIGTSAKGVIMFPEDQMPEGWTVDDLKTEWTKVGGFILYKPRPGATPPQQVSVNSTNVGAYELLNIQLQFMKEISGIYGALQGQQAKSGTSATQYIQEAQNSSANLIDVLTSFNKFRERRDTKLMKVIQQYYDRNDYIGIAGKAYTEEAKNYDAEKVRKAHFDLTITEANSYIGSIQRTNEFLLQLYQMGGIGVKELLENGRFDFSDRLLESIERREQQMIQQQQMMMQGQGMQAVPQQAMANPVPDDIMNMVRENSNPNFNKEALA